MTVNKIFKPTVEVDRWFIKGNRLFGEVINDKTRTGERMRTPPLVFRDQEGGVVETQHVRYKLLKQLSVEDLTGGKRMEEDKSS